MKARQDARGGTGRRTRLTAVAGIVAGLVLLGPAPAASAHTSLRFSDPAADSVLTAPPRSVRLEFAGPVRSADPRIAVTVAGHEPVEVPATIDGATVTADLRAVTVPGADGPGPTVWTLGFRLLAADGDPFSGLLRFTVSPPGAASGGPEPTVDTGAGLPAAPGTDSGGAAPWVMMGAAVAAVAAAGTAAVVARRRGGSGPVRGRRPKEVDQDDL